MNTVKEVNIKDQLIDIKPTYETYNWPLVFTAGFLVLIFMTFLFFLVKKLWTSEKVKDVELEINWEKLIDGIAINSTSVQEVESQMMMLLKSFLEANAKLPFSSKSDNETIELIHSTSKLKKEQRELVITFLTDAEIRRFSSEVNIEEGHIEKRKNELKDIVKNLSSSKGDLDELR